MFRLAWLFSLIFFAVGGYAYEEICIDEYAEGYFDIDTFLTDSQPFYPDDSLGSLQEPAIQGLYLQKGFTLRAPYSVMLNPYYYPDNQITTQSGMQRFFPHNDGVEIKQSGLYRVSFFQRVFTRDPETNILVFLVCNPGGYQKRYQTWSFEPQSSSDIHFQQILRLKAGDKLQVVIRAVKGEITFGPDRMSSGFAIEEVR